MINKNYMIVSKNKYFNNFITIKVKKKTFVSIVSNKKWQRKK